MSMAIEPYHGTTPLGSAEHWVALTDQQRLHQAITACQDHDAPLLWSLTLAHIATFGRSGSTVSPHTIRGYRQGVDRLVADWQTEDLRKPRREAAALWLRRLEERGWVRADGSTRPYQPQTVHLYFTAARHLYAALRWAGATTADPFADVRPARDKTPAYDKRSPYSTTQVRALLAAADQCDQVVILLCAHAGLRISEAMDLTWDAVSLEAESLHVRYGKGGRSRTVPLSTSLRALLEVWRATSQDGYVIPYRDRRTAWKRLKGVAERAGVPWLGVHALRHTAGTELVRETGDLEVAARLLGHQQLETTRVYIKWSDDRLKKTLKGW